MPLSESRSVPFQGAAQGRAVMPKGLLTLGVAGESANPAPPPPTRVVRAQPAAGEELGVGERVGVEVGEREAGVLGLGVAPGVGERLGVALALGSAQVSLWTMLLPLSEMRKTPGGEAAAT